VSPSVMPTTLPWTSAALAKRGNRNVRPESVGFYSRPSRTWKGSERMRREARRSSIP
jgi:hypothetical protein